MTLVLLALSIVLVAVPASAGTVVDVFESTVKAIGPIETDLDTFPLTSFTKASTPCICQEGALANTVGVVFIQKAPGPGLAATYFAVCLLPTFSTTGGLAATTQCLSFTPFK